MPRDDRDILLDVNSRETETELYDSLFAAVRYLESNRKISQQLAENLEKMIRDRFEHVLKDFDRAFSRYDDIYLSEIEKFAEDTVVDAVNAILESQRSRSREYDRDDRYSSRRHRDDRDYRRDGYRDRTESGTSGSFGRSRNSNRNRDDRIFEERRDQARMENASNAARDKHSRYARGQFDQENTVVHDEADTTLAEGRAVRTAFEFVGIDATNDEIVKLQATNHPERQIKTDVMTVVSSDTCTQELTSIATSKRIFIPPVYEDSEVLGYLKHIDPVMFSSGYFFHLVEYRKLRHVNIPEHGVELMHAQKQLRELLTKCSVLEDISANVIPYINELKIPVQEYITASYFERFNAIAGMYLYQQDKPNIFLAANNWRGLGCYFKIPTDVSVEVASILNEYIDVMKAAFGANYGTSVFEVIKAAFVDAFGTGGSIINLNQHHFEYLTGFRDIPLVIDNKYINRDLAIMPQANRDAYIGAFMKDHAVHVTHETAIYTNMSLKAAAPHPSNTVVVNAIEPLHVIAKLFLTNMRPTRVTITELNKDCGIVKQGAIGVGNDGRVKITYP